MAKTDRIDKQIIITTKHNSTICCQQETHFTSKEKLIESEKMKKGIQIK